MSILLLPGAGSTRESTHSLDCYVQGLPSPSHNIDAYIAVPSYSHMCGFEQGPLFNTVSGECWANTTARDTVQVQSAVINPGGGKYALECNSSGTSTAANAIFHRFSMQSGSYLQTPGLFFSVRFYINVVSIGSTTTIYNGAGSIKMTPAGNLIIGSPADPGSLVTTVQALSFNTWHRINLVVNNNSSPRTLALYVDGILWATTSTFFSLGAGDGVTVGTNSAGEVGTGHHLFIDDILWDNSFAGFLIPPGVQRLLLPVADSNRGNWTGGLGGTTNLWQALDNISPNGQVPASETNLTQIRNPSATVPGDYVGIFQSYDSIFILPNFLIQAVVAIQNGGVESTTVSDFGTLWIVSNPAQSDPGTPLDFIFFDQFSAVANPFQSISGSGWQSHLGQVSTNPSVVKTAQPTALVRKRTATTDPTILDFFAIYVDYQPQDQSYSHNLDAYVQAVNSNSHNLDASIQAQAVASSVTHNLDVDVQVDSLKVHNLDADVQINQSNTHNLDCYIQASFSKTHNLDTDVQQDSSKIHTIDCYIQSFSSNTHNVDADVQQDFNKIHNIDCYVQSFFNKSHNIDAVVQQDSNKVHSIDCYIQTTNNYTHNVDCYVQTTSNYSHNIDCFVQVTATSDISHNIDTYIQITKILAHAIDAVVQITSTVTHSVDCVIQIDQSETYSIDCVIQTTGTDTHSIDCFVFSSQQVNDDSHIIDVYIQSSSDNVHFLDCYILVNVTPVTSTLACEYEGFRIKLFDFGDGTTALTVRVV